MPTVSLTFTTPVPAPAVWEALVDIAAYPTYMPDVLRVDILSAAGSDRVSRWKVLLKGSEMNWTEREHLDNDLLRLEFEQIEGDLATYRGFNQVRDADGVTEVRMEVEFDIGIPEVADMLHPIAAHALEENLRTTMAHLEWRAGAGTAP